MELTSSLAQPVVSGRRGVLALLHLSPARLVSLVITIAAFVGPVHPRPDPDTWWHIATGRWMFAHGKIPTADPFSWTAHGQPWVAHEWGSDLIFSALNRSVGPASLLLLSGLLIGAAFLLLRSTLRIITDNEWVVALCLAGAFYLSTLMWSLRPHLVSILFVALFLRVLVGARFRGETRALWWLIPATAIWCNLHAGFISGVVLMWVFAVVTLLERRREAKTLLVVAIASTVAGALNPAGFGIYPFALYLAKVSKNVQEWQPPNLRTTYGIAFSGIALGTLLLPAMIGRKVDRALLALAAAFIFLGFGAVRNVPLAGFLSVPCLAYSLDSWGRVPLPRLETGFARLALAALAIVTLIGSAALIGDNLVGKSPAQLLSGSNRYFPVRAAQFLSHQPKGRMVNPYDWGGYLIYRTPRFPVSIDGRADMYGPKLLKDDERLEKLEPGWRQYLARERVHYVLWLRSQPLAQALRLDPSWRLIYHDHTSVLFEHVFR